MGRGWKILIAIVVAGVVLLGLNALSVDHETKAAGVTEPGGRLLNLRGGEIEVVDRGPRDASPIVLIHCFSCAINYWSGMIPLLAREHRVVAVDLLGHGGSEKPSSGYTVSVALAERSPQLVSKVMIIDTPPDHSGSSLGLVAKLGFAPVIGEFFWRVKPDFAVKKGLAVAFAPGFDVPDEFVENVKRMTYTSYHDSPTGSEDYTDEKPLDQRMKESGQPLMVIMGAEEQIIDDPAKRLAEYRATVPGAQTKLIVGAGHSPNVEKPAATAALLLAFASQKTALESRFLP
jgi:pimeloyl-ACP methyl ester carboxylesterase